MSAVSPSRPDIIAFLSTASQALCRPLPTPKDVFQFSNDGDAKLSNSLLTLALRRLKTATTTWPVPSPRHWNEGDLSVILDGSGAPKALMRTTELRERKFVDVPDDFALAEAEGSAQDWRDGHVRYFKRLGEVGGMRFDAESSWVLCERFEVLYPPIQHMEEDGNS